MPELPDLVVYAEALARRVVGERLERIRLGSPFVLRTVTPPLVAAAGREALAEFDRGGIEVLETDEAVFAAALRRANHTVKRALTDPAVVAGIGNAYSDEILHRAGLSPVALTRSFGDEEISRLFAACRSVLTEWTERLRREAGDGFPEHVTAFREGMAVHGRHGQPCLDCGAPVQRIVFADREVNYCARCQTGGRLLADRALSRLLRGDWPRSLEELEERSEAHKRGNPAGHGSVDEA